MAADLYAYVRDERSKIPNAKRTPYVFLARDGKPLSAHSLNGMYRLLRDRAGGVPEHATPHVSRHDWNERFSDYAEAAGMSEAEEAQARNHQMGWTKMSKQGEGYQRRRTAKRANEAAIRMQDKSWSKGEG
jgi:integrase